MELSDYYVKYIGERKNCATCGKPTNFGTLKEGFSKYCSRLCCLRNPEANLKRVKSSLKSIDQTNEKRRQTNLKKFGVENPYQSEEIKNKIKKTNLLKYGNEHSTRVESINIRRQTSLKNTLLEKGSEINEQRKQTCFNKLGVYHQMYDTKIKNKVMSSLKDRFLRERFDLILKIRNVKILEEYNKTAYDEYDFQCLICDTTFKSTYFNVYQYSAKGRCQKCHPALYYSKISKGQQEVLTFIQESFPNLEVIANDRTQIAPKELDIYIPSKKLAIEYCGLYWHSEACGVDQNYHLNKLQECESKGIRLITIFEDEWLFKQDIVKSVLRYKLNHPDIIRIHARKCIIKEVPTKDKTKFLEENHLQGSDSSTIKLGAYYNNELVSVMTFAKPSIAKGSGNKIAGVYELSRFSIKRNYNVVGIASKILHYFRQQYQWLELYTFADLRWSSGNLYKQLGMKELYKTTPGYWYSDGVFREHRFKHRKKESELKEIPEHIIRSQQGLFRIWDCGHIKYKLNSMEK